MTYRQTLDYLYARLPMFHRIGLPAYKADLKNTVELCSLLGNPQEKFQSVHIAGTNGKGSVSHMVSSVLQTAGYKTGLYTSPHLKDFRERIKINGKMIPRSYITRFVRKYKSEFKKTEPSFFEWTVVLAFDFFAAEKVDVAVIEVGLGGRLDSTNIITPVLSVITNISYDHTDILGKTVQKIAYEKAGIIKPGIPVVIGESQKESRHVFIKTASKNHSPIFFADKNFFYPELRSDLTGSYQRKNIRTVVQAVELLRSAGFILTEGELKSGLANVVKNTGLMGRWQTVKKNPLVICDVAHNEAGIAEVIRQAKADCKGNLHIVFGTVSDKDTGAILKHLPKSARYYFCRARIPRALDEKILYGKAEKFALPGETFSSVKKALRAATKKAEKDDMILVTGSTFVVAEVI
ncbi:MAG: bifunctional folylpolyglutamate synthase/dihydrofolate synthase [Bacteroidetes bacterium]|nr:bifunctional folylpolyglutamate synthase/dihydrofolate synthase [Bacteroidota bacterium]